MWRSRRCWAGRHRRERRRRPGRRRLAFSGVRCGSSIQCWPSGGNCGARRSMMLPTVPSGLMTRILLPSLSSATFVPEKRVTKASPGLSAAAASLVWAMVTAGQRTSIEQTAKVVARQNQVERPRNALGPDIRARAGRTCATSLAQKENSLIRVSPRNATYTQEHSRWIEFITIPDHSSRAQWTSCGLCIVRPKPSATHFRPVMIFGSQPPRARAVALDASELRGAVLT